MTKVRPTQRRREGERSRTTPPIFAKREQKNAREGFEKPGLTRTLISSLFYAALF